MADTNKVPGTSRPIVQTNVTKRVLEVNFLSFQIAQDALCRGIVLFYRLSMAIHGHVLRGCNRSNHFGESTTFTCDLDTEVERW